MFIPATATYTKLQTRTTERGNLLDSDTPLVGFFWRGPGYYVRYVTLDACSLQFLQLVAFFGPAMMDVDMHCS